MDPNHDPKLVKPLSSKTLEETIKDKYTYRQIVNNCILAITCMNEKEREDAIDRLRRYIPDGKRVYVGSSIKENIRKIYWTFEDAKSWQFVTEIPVIYETHRFYSGIIRICMN